MNSRFQFVTLTRPNKTRQRFMLGQIISWMACAKEKGGAIVFTTDTEAEWYVMETPERIDELVRGAGE